MIQQDAAIRSNRYPDDVAVLAGDPLQRSQRVVQHLQRHACLLYTSTAHLRPGRFSGIACQPARLERLFRTSQAAFRETSVYSTAFLTGSASHSKTSVTHSKQTTETFLTGSRIARGEKRTINSVSYTHLDVYKRQDQT